MTSGFRSYSGSRAVGHDCWAQVIPATSHDQAAHAAAAPVAGLHFRASCSGANCGRKFDLSRPVGMRCGETRIRCGYCRGGDKVRHGTGDYEPHHGTALRSTGLRLLRYRLAVPQPLTSPAGSTASGYSRISG